VCINHTGHKDLQKDVSLGVCADDIPESIQSAFSGHWNKRYRF